MHFFALFIKGLFLLLSMALLLQSCSPKAKKIKSSEGSNEVQETIEGQKTSIENLQNEIAKLKQRIKEQENPSQEQVEAAQVAKELSNLRSKLGKLKDGSAEKKQLLEEVERLEAKLATLNQKIDPNKTDIDALKARLFELIKKFNEKLKSQSLAHVNRQLYVKELMSGHTELYPLTGSYKVLVIPVQFSDKKFADPEHLQTKMQGLLFDPTNEKSMRTYYRHASLGKFDVDGTVADIVTVDGKLEDYGKALPGKSDVNAGGLVKQALQKVTATKNDPHWWSQFDQWDLSDYDKDKNFNEPDGFVDAVVLIYAGKSQSSCQRSFDTEGKRPGSDEFPKDDPRYKNAIECFNRIWPHRSSIQLAADDPDRSTQGPLVEGVTRSSLNGLKINDQLFAFDYNMQSEYSDLSTFMHEFGHSLTLPDIYASRGDNSVGQWELMAHNASNQAQELSTFSKLSLGWVKPKVIKSGEASSFYLGAYNFVSKNQRDSAHSFSGPDIYNETDSLGVSNQTSILSTTPNFKEPVYRSAVVTTPAQKELIKVTDYPEHIGTVAGYTGRYDNAERSYKLEIAVPENGPTELSFDTFYFIETDSNFKSAEKEIKTSDYDIGEIRVNGEIIEQLRTISGDYVNAAKGANEKPEKQNHDTLNENHPACDVTTVLKLRTKYYSKQITAEEVKIYQEKLALCHQPTWVKKKFDLSKYRGQTVKFEIAYRTDPAYTEFGIIFDNIRFGDMKIDFESGQSAGDFQALRNGQYEKDFHQLYLLEYRTPGMNFSSGDQQLSYNMDNNIVSNSQSMFVDGADPLQQFRMLKMNYQPGLVAWYFNSKFDDRSNNPSVQDGKGYLLVLNPKVQEVPIPGLFSDEQFFKDGHYLDPDKDAPLKKVVEAQRNKLICFGYTEYSKFITGKEPDCSSFGSEWIDYLAKLTFEDKKLIYRRQGFNEVLPHKRYANWGVGKPFRTASSSRTSIAVFRPPGSKEMKPYTVYKAVEGKMVVDQELTDSQKPYPAISSFNDKKQEKPKHKPFLEDSTLVEKVGFKFHLTSPSKKTLGLYSKEATADENGNYFRRPLVRVHINWE